MPEPVITTDNNPNPTPAPGTDPKPPVNADPSTDLDTSKWTDEQWAKVYADPKLYNNPRFKDLTSAKQERDTLKAEKDAAEKKRLEEAGEHEKLRKLAEKERDEAKSQLNNVKLDTAIERAAAKAGAIDADAVAKLINRSGIKITDTGEIEGIDEAIKTLVTDKAYLFGKGSTSTVGNPTNPANPNTGTRYKLSQLQDPKFYREHQADIQLAMKENRIENDQR